MYIAVRKGNNVKISELIKELQEAQDYYGDMPLTTYDGDIDEIKITAAKDGVAYPLVEGTHNELEIEIMTKWIG